jgi:steroid delta-isomerase-like uncharacterized protein
MCIPRNRRLGYVRRRREERMSASSEYPARAEAAFNRRDTDGLAALWAPDFEYEGPGGERSTGRAAAIVRERALWAAFPDIQADLSRHLVAGERLVIEGRMRGTHDGPLRLGSTTVPASGRRIDVAFVALFRFVDGLVAHERVVYDRADLLVQLGVVAAAEER